MKQILAFAGSNSKNSINKELVAYASSKVDGAEVQLLDLNDFDLPLYGMDHEIEHGIPDNAKQFLEHIKSADGIVVSLAEHNGSYATVFKNLFDWMSRIEAKTFFGKPMLLMATSPGGRGGESVLEAAADRFPRHDANIVGKFSLPSFGTHFENGQIIDANLNTELLEEIKQFQESL
ncbi:NAD(P)H-dependent FMN reductase [Formosa sp. Hel1_31_208]|uniref:NADPH-dependent FMN reductase n=1 Tax=Formosa sp. Hel1_31_208 TaxID=1798225 RepID=UPI00087B2DC2|nr:NAD(P)H-dependent oxidoreductase [Formosa sp. Hel1_31_208]SDS47474.1 NAD(P)H-dependent FMN reductase [Formosa sp. Hel1_31_208]